MENNSNFLKESLNAFFSEITLFKKVFLLFVIVTILVTFFYPPTYDIGGKFLVKGRLLPSSVDNLSANAESNQVIPAVTQDIETEVNLILSPQFFQFAAKRMENSNIAPFHNSNFVTEAVLQISEFFNKITRGVKSLFTEDSSKNEIESLLWKELLMNVDASIAPGTNLVQLSYMTKFPKEDLHVAKFLMDSYIVYRLTSNTNFENVFFDSRIDDYKKNYTALENQKSSLLLDMNLVTDVNTEVDRLSSDIQRYETELEALREQQKISRVWINYVQNTIKVLMQQRKDLKVMPPFPLNFESTDIREINSRLFELMIEYTRLSSTYTEQFGQSQDVSQTLKNLERYILKMGENELTLRKTQLNIITEQIKDKTLLINQTREQLQHLKEVSPQIVILNSQLESLQNVIQTLIRRSEETKLYTEAGSLLQIPNLAIAAEPALPKGPVFPRKRIVLPLGIIGAALMGLLTVFLKHMVKRSFATPRDVEVVLGLPTLAIVKDKNYATPKISILWDLRDIIKRN